MACALLPLLCRPPRRMRCSLQTFHVDIARRHRSSASIQPAWVPSTLQAAVNSKAAQLGYPIALTHVHSVPYGFSARFDSISKTYLYRLYFPQHKSGALHAPPLAADGTSWFVRSPLDTPAMQAAADAMAGRHDCSVLRSAGCQAVSPVKSLEQVSVLLRPPPTALANRDPGEGAGPTAASLASTAAATGDVLDNLVHDTSGLSRVEILVKGPSFLYNMVRNIAGLLVWVGQGHATPEHVASWLEQGAPRSIAKYATAPAHGLTLLGVEYPPLDPLLHEVRLDQARLCPGQSEAAAQGMPPCSGACSMFDALSGALKGDPSAAVAAYAAASGGGAECCRALHSARRVRTMHTNGSLDADGWSEDAHAQLLKQYGGRAASRDPAQAASHEADWAARRSRAAQRSRRIMTLSGVVLQG